MSFSSSDPNALLRQATALHQAGNLPAAIALYRQLLRQYPTYPPLLNMLGTAELQSGHTEEGVAMLGRSLAITADQPGVLSNRGCGLLALGRAGQALDDFERAIALQPGNPEAHSNRGNALKTLGRLDDAVAAYARAIASRPNYADAYYNRGVVLAELNRPAEALADFDRALAARPDYAKAHSNRAAVLLDLLRAAEALAAAERAAALVPDYAAAHCNRGKALVALGRHADALAAFDRAIAITPDDGDFFFSRGNAHHAMNRPERALADFDRALALGRNEAETRTNRVAALIDLDRPEEALAECDAILARFPAHAGAHLNRGCVLLEENRLDEGRTALRQALALEPDYPEAQSRLAMLELQTGDFASGWPRYEARWKTPAYLAVKPNLAQPLWLGETPLQGKTLLVHSEQGLGDHIQFARYLPMAAALGARLVFEVPAPLKALLGSLKGDIVVIAKGEPLPPFDVYCPLMSLPLAFKTALDSIPAGIPYLAADPARVARWRETLGEKTGPRVGLAWSGVQRQPVHRKRSVPLLRLAPLLSLPCEFHSLHKDVSGEDAALLPPRAVHAAEDMDFAGTAALIALMDIVVSVDTSVAHVAGALGKPLLLMLPFAAEWRWLTDRSDTPWYPNATLYRQPAKGDWDSVVSAVQERLQGLCGE